MTPENLQAVLKSAEGSPDVVLVGGQAIVVWTSYYNHASEFQPPADPVTTKDVDFYGSSRQALAIARLVNGTVRIPQTDDATPSSAVIDLGTTSDEDERIDFLDHVQGAGDKAVSAAAIPLNFEMHGPDGPCMIRVRVMHPFHCLKSKLSNKSVLGRNTATANAQLEATSTILREFIDDMISQGQDEGEGAKICTKIATDTVKELGSFLERDIVGRDAHLNMQHDPLESPIQKLLSNTSML
ncbi:hypothetical protein HT136_24255 [Novosphingobium profundi]|uniref:hypothetical protein n=1 Tax=Novosphingobium profundi TaxID=1774954 RepID=UPI001BDA3C00|nr:hypothetical protein [Novosphingobium profundi]MBT0671488.1 hypothetical protein [Novosphingobium profundi]